MATFNLPQYVAEYLESAQCQRIETLKVWKKYFSDFGLTPLALDGDNQFIFYCEPYEDVFSLFYVVAEVFPGYIEYGWYGDLDDQCPGPESLHSQYTGSPKAEVGVTKVFAKWTTAVSRSHINVHTRFFPSFIEEIKEYLPYLKITKYE